MNERWKSVLIFCFLLSIPALMLIYPYLNSPSHGIHSPATGLDKEIPFLKIFVIPYIAWIGYIFVTLTFLCLKDRKLGYKTILVFDFGLLVCYIIYYFFQTEGPVRPVITGHDILSRLLQYVYLMDHPYNSFPNIHTMSSYLMMRAIRTSSWKNKWNQGIIYFCSTSIICATLFIKQHFLMDVLAAILLVECLFKSIEISFQVLFKQKGEGTYVKGKPNSYPI